MRTKEAMIMELVEFAGSIMRDGSINSNIRGVVIIVYSPEELGVDDDCWHSVINCYGSKIDAMNRFAETPCTDSIVINRIENSSDGIELESDADYTERIRKQIIDFVVNL